MMESAKQLEERLLYTREYAMQDEQTNEKAHVFCEDYKQFLNQGKTEREVAKVCEERLLAAGYKAFEPGRRYQPGEKIYLLHREKCVIAATIGSVDMERGFRLNAAHIDSPRLDLRPMPLFENGGMAFFRTHYYGGIRTHRNDSTCRFVVTRARNRKTFDPEALAKPVGRPHTDETFTVTLAR